MGEGGEYTLIKLGRKDKLHFAIKARQNVVVNGRNIAQGFHGGSFVAENPNMTAKGSSVGVTGLTICENVL